MFRFSIREIVLLTLIVALACGWVVEHGRARRLGAERAALANEVAASTNEIRRLHRVNEIVAAQWAKALGNGRSTRLAQ
jgi:hypothetical protein